MSWCFKIKLSVLLSVILQAVLLGLPFVGKVVKLLQAKLVCHLRYTYEIDCHSLSVLKVLQKSLLTSR